MPRSPRGPCTFPGCRSKATHGARCRRHRRPLEGHPLQGFYRSRPWRNLADQVRREEPDCRCPGCPHHEGPCGQPTEDADHIVSITDGGAMMDRANLRGICRPCHVHKTWADRAARG